MYIHVNGRNIEITEAIKAYVKEKIGKVATRYDQIQGIDVVLSVIKRESTV
jgi:ribosomal subunit interface protein